MKLAIVFPGQGVQNKILKPDDPIIAEHVEFHLQRANEILGTEIGFDQPPEYYNRSCLAQPAILAYGYGVYRWIERTYKVQPNCLFGHSLGEITALTAANAISFEQAVKLVHSRGELMDKAGESRAGGMLAIQGIPKRELKYYCENASQENSVVQVANENGHTQVVVSGDLQAIAEMEKIMSNFGRVTCIRLEVSGAFHSPLMETILPEFSKELSKVEWRKPKVPVISSVDVGYYSDQQEIPVKLLDQVCSKVRWTETVSMARRDGVSVYVDAGPGSILKTLISRQLANSSGAGTAATALSSVDDRDKVQLEDSVQQIQQKYLNQLISACVSEPAKKQGDQYAGEVVEPFRKLQAIKERASETLISFEQMELALALKNEVLQNKQI